MRAIDQRFSAHADDISREQDRLFYAIYALGVIYDRSHDGSNSSQNKELAFKLHCEALRLRVVRNRTFSIVSAQAEFLTCLYYLTMSMFAEAWMAVGSLARSLQAIGLHRFTKVDSPTHFDCEDGKRLFWCAYCLDRYLSAMLGRPNAFQDRDIDADFPTLVSDVEENEVYGLGSAGPCLMTAALAHFKLAKIVGCITTDIYGPSCRDISQRQQLIVALRNRVNDWAEQLPAYLSPHSGGRLPLLPTYARQASVLNLAYWHAILSLYRSYVVLRSPDPSLDATFVSVAQDEALEAAQSIATAVRQIHDSGHYTFGFWFTSYIAFSASLVMIVSTSQLHPNESRYASLDSSIRSCMLFLESVGRINRVTDLYFKVVQNIRNAVRENAPQVNNAIPDSAVDFDWSWFDETFAMNQAQSSSGNARQHVMQDHETSYLGQYNPGFFQSPADMLEAYVISTTT
ncbi:protein of unknown function [Taphrina deformans PYCC 5710]|uniref:Xylanolytic transcriptional activator regulatory domain-containing protein n=1 Tax=Taphrina deformans (strain PYCC 5710 / ATCC 11124 / CBS 356.35 / IMI 108563 / JCM 9778 / NBRC 8474) TaxID=1097556 RepID=R4XF28_TAPDE|nr:protein of unknown function [Taphrina deformans PYCC 5710]|eukprot:CCG84472.1 protein of unknown function [Taphrina deformans PYCC 5710]